MNKSITNFWHNCNNIFFNAFYNLLNIFLEQTLMSIVSFQENVYEYSVNYCKHWNVLCFVIVKVLTLWVDTLFAHNKHIPFFIDCMISKITRSDLLQVETVRNYASIEKCSLFSHPCYCYHHQMSRSSLYSWDCNTQKMLSTFTRTLLNFEFCDLGFAVWKKL